MPNSSFSVDRKKYIYLFRISKSWSCLIMSFKSLVLVCDHLTWNCEFLNCRYWSDQNVIAVLIWKYFGFSIVYPLNTYRNTIAYIIVSYGQYHSTIDLSLCSSLTPEKRKVLRENPQSDVIMRVMASQIASLKIVYSTAYSGADQRKHQSSASLAFVRGILRWPVNSPHKWPVTWKMFPFDDVIMPSDWIDTAII